MKRFLYTLICAAMCLMSSCDKKWEWNIPLAVNNTEIKLPSNLGGYIYVPVYSTVTWTVSFETAGGTQAQWLHPDITEGCGFDVCVKVDYDANADSADREAYMIISPKEPSDDVKALSIHLIQSGTK